MTQKNQYTGPFLYSGKLGHNGLGVDRIFYTNAISKADFANDLNCLLNEDQSMLPLSMQENDSLYIGYSKALAQIIGDFRSYGGGTDETTTARLLYANSKIQLEKQSEKIGLFKKNQDLWLPADMDKGNWSRWKAARKEFVLISSRNPLDLFADNALRPAKAGFDAKEKKLSISMAL